MHSMDIREYMDGYDREFDQNEFDQKLWEAMQEDDFEFSEDFEVFCKEYGIFNIHDYLRMLRIKRKLI